MCPELSAGWELGTSWKQVGHAVVVDVHAEGAKGRGTHTSVRVSASERICYLMGGSV